MEAHKCYDIASRYDKEIVVMEPVKGGTLADLPDEALRLLHQAAPHKSAASWAIRFAQSLEQVSAILAKGIAIPCTGCRYCVKDCPQNIAIPDYFRIYNTYSRYPEDGWKMKPVYASIAQSNGKVSDCIHCHTCEQNCPQQIPITNWLKEVGKAFV